MYVRNCIAIIEVLIVFLASCVCGFLLDTNSDPCSYSDTSIDCSNRDLTSIPVFNLTRYTDVCLNSINLGNNKLTIIGNDAFIQFRYLNCSKSINLGENNISQIHDYAFRGIEGYIETLDLIFNSLHSLPEAIGSILNLKSLSLLGNQIMSLNPSVMAKIGRSLTYFVVRLYSFQQWPTELHFLNELQTLYLYDIPFQFLDSSAFRGLTHLKSLFIRYSNLKKIPNAICTLSDLTSLEIFSNHVSFLNESKSDVFEPCNHITVTQNVESVQYVHNQVDFFPNIFTMFPTLRYIDMHDNGMRFMNTDNFVDNFSALTLDLRYNQFRRIPSGLNMFKSLNALRLDHNIIEFIEDNDLFGLRNLASIDLPFNPIQFITKRAFQNNIKLYKVDLSGTFLTTIPAAITMLPALHTLRLEATHIECTCELASLKNWNVSAMQIYGQCYQRNEGIDQFIKTYINAGRC